MDEKTAQESLQTWLQGLSEFANADVVINDFSIFDGARDKGPFAIISNSDRWRSRQVGSVAEDTWPIPVFLLVPFTKDQETLNTFRDTRQVIINEINDNTGNRTPVPGADISEVFPGTDVMEWFEEGTKPEEFGTFPLYIFQVMLFQVETF